jgi:hypothetical protein
MSNVILPTAIWAAIGLAGLSLLIMGVSGIRSILHGKVQPLTIGIIAIPGVLVLVLRLAFGGSATPWVQAGMYTLVIMFGFLLLAMLFTGLRQLFRSAFS